MNTNSKGKLYLVPAPLDFGCDTTSPLEHVLPAHTLQTAAGLSHWVCENAKSTRAYLNRIHLIYPLQTPLQAHHITELPRAVHKKGDHGNSTSAQWDAKPLLAAALEGNDIGLVSEAGMPAVADPGSSVVRAAHVLGIEVVPLVGPVSLLLTLAASGLNGQNFAFVGYLPQDPSARVARIRALEALCSKEQQTQMFIETPYRNNPLMQALVETLRPNSLLTVACGLTLSNASIRTQTAAQWRSGDYALDGRVPTVFAIGA